MAKHRGRGLLAVGFGVVLLAFSAAEFGAAKQGGSAPAIDRACDVRGPEPRGDGRGGDALATDWATEPYLRPRGQLQATMLFVDFTDAIAAAGSTQVIERALAPVLRRWLSKASYGRAELRVGPHHAWIRMPKPSTTYWPPGGVFKPGEYIRDAVASADPVVDFSGTDLLYIVAAPGSQVVLSPAHTEPRLQADGTTLTRFVTLGQDTFSPDHHPAQRLVQGTAHLFSLPYLDDLGQAGAAGNRWAGAWDPMGEPGLLSNPNAWSKRKLGWLRPGKDMICIKRGRLTRTLSALSRKRGLRAISVRLDARRRYVIEARRRKGLDRGICSEGVLVWLVDARKGSGDGPMRVQPARDDSDNPARRCRAAGISGALDRAPFRPGKAFRDRSEGVKVEVLGSTKRGFRVRVSRR